MANERHTEAWHALEGDLAAAGVPRATFLGAPISRLDTLVNTRIPAKPYVGILLKHVPDLNMREKAWIARIVTEKGLKEAVPFLLSMYNDYEEAPEEPVDWYAVGNALYTIDDKNSYPAIFEICKNERYGWNRIALFGTLARMKTNDAYQLLVDFLGHEDIAIRAEAVVCLGRFGNVEAIPLIEAVDLGKNKRGARVKEVALNKLRKKIDTGR